MLGTSNGCLQRHGRCQGIPTATARDEKSTRPGRQILHSKIQDTAKIHVELEDETCGNNIKRMQDSEVNFLR